MEYSKYLPAEQAEKVVALVQASDAAAQEAVAHRSLRIMRFL